MSKGRFSAEQIIRADDSQRWLNPACVQRVPDSAGPVMPTCQNVPHGRVPDGANRTRHLPLCSTGYRIPRLEASSGMAALHITRNRWIRRRV